MTNTRTPQRERVDAIEFVDIVFQVLAAQISGNFLGHIKKDLIPRLENNEEFPLRELRTLMCVAHFSYPVKGSTIVKTMGYDPATVTRSTRVLIERGMITGEPNENDARSTVYALTEKGKDLSTAYRDEAKKSTLELNRLDPSSPTKKQLQQAVDVLVWIRDRSALTKNLDKKPPTRDVAGDILTGPPQT